MNKKKLSAAAQIMGRSKSPKKIEAVTKNLPTYKGEKEEKKKTV